MRGITLGRRSDGQAATGPCWLVQLGKPAGTPSEVQRTLAAVAKGSTRNVSPLSDAFQQTALAEREKLIQRYEECRAHHEELLEEVQQTALEAERYLKTIRELGEVLEIEDQLSLTTLNEELRGDRLREIAADVLWRHHKIGDVVHYKDWLALVVAEGHRVGGKNSAATFLTQVARETTVERVGRRTGLYRLIAQAG